MSVLDTNIGAGGAGGAGGAIRQREHYADDLPANVQVVVGGGGAAGAGNTAAQGGAGAHGAAGGASAFQAAADEWAPPGRAVGAGRPRRQRRQQGAGLSWAS